MLSSQTSQNRGFTLIELLVVIAIIAIMAAIGITAYATTQATARDSTRRSLITQLGKAIEGTKDASTGVYKYTDADYSNDFARSAGGVIYTDPANFSTRYVYCVKTSTATGTSWTPTVDGTWTSSVCATGGTATLQTSLTAGAGCVTGGICFGDVKSWVLCARLERSATAYCVNSSQ